MAKPNDIVLRFSERERRLYDQLVESAQRSNLDLSVMAKSIIFGALLRGEGFETIVEIGSRAARAPKRRRATQKWVHEGDDWVSPPWRITKPGGLKYTGTTRHDPAMWWRLRRDDRPELDEPLSSNRLEAIRIATELIRRNKYP